MTNIWNDGYIINRDGVEIKLTNDEIRNIYNLIEAQNGRGSIEYWIESCGEDASEEELKVANEMMEDEKACRLVWDGYLESVFYDSGYAELDAVHYTITDIIREESRND